MLCSYGCDRKSIKIFNNGKYCCSSRADQCPEIIKKRIESRKITGPWHTEETKEKIRQAKMGTELSKEWRENISKSNTGRVVSEDTKLILSNQKLGKSNPMFGKIPWNKGLTGATNERIDNIAKMQIGISKNKGQVAWNKGKKKLETSEILSRNDPIYSNFRKYRNRIAVRTRKVYEQFKHEINPMNLLLGKCGIDGAYQIDHIISVRQGFDQGISVEMISAKENLQILPWLDNVLKYDGKGNRKGQI